MTKLVKMTVVVLAVILLAGGGYAGILRMQVAAELEQTKKSLLEDAQRGFYGAEFQRAHGWHKLSATYLSDYERGRNAESLARVSRSSLESSQIESPRYWYSEYETVADDVHSQVREAMKRKMGLNFELNEEMEEQLVEELRKDDRVVALEAIYEASRTIRHCSRAIEDATVITEVRSLAQEMGSHEKVLRRAIGRLNQVLGGVLSP